MLRLVLATAIFCCVLATACGGDGGQPTPAATGTQSVTGTPTGAIDLEAAAVTVSDLPEGWQPYPAADSELPSGFEQSFFSTMTRGDGSIVRVNMMVSDPEDIAEMREAIKTLREQQFGASTTALDEVVPGAWKSVATVDPTVVDELITFEAGPVLTVVWVTFPVGSEAEPSVESLATLAYERILEQLQ